MSPIAVPKEVLAALIHMADEYVQDVESGIEEGLYAASENPDIEQRKAHLNAAVEALMAAEGQISSGQSSVPVKYWDCYNSEYETVHTHQFDVDDQRKTNGQMYMDVGSLDGNLDDMLCVTMEVNTNPLNGIDHVPCAHIAFDGDNLAMSLFKVGNRILMRPETDVSIDVLRDVVYGAPETLYWVK